VGNRATKKIKTHRSDPAQQGTTLALAFSFFPTSKRVLNKNVHVNSLEKDPSAVFRQ